ncbi:unnamed protein product [Strongylus vulgaris]|uniref:Uncharacterized protein n=1 Tax=Strongylus vulgaris TaxID=40348 RepID=A0A3P7JR61_STRVU|nr:unnamed protein product [Strongylus vulgaris]
MSGNPVYKSVLPTFWLCLKLWSKIASTEQMANVYQSDGEELRTIVKEGEDGMKEVDPAALSRLESALGKAAVKRKADAIDEEESDASDVDDAEIFLAFIILSISNHYGFIKLFLAYDDTIAEVSQAAIEARCRRP